jgi:uncharacterized protein
MQTTLPANTAVWFEIPVTQFETAKRFYGAVLGHPLTDEEGDGLPHPMANFPQASKASVAGHVYPGRPAERGTGITIHLAVADLEGALARVSANGGEVVSPVLAIADGRFAYCLDPDGNSFGLFTR